MENARRCAAALVGAVPVGGAAAEEFLPLGEGRVYRGEVLNGHPHSEGTLTWPSGATYTGQWVDGAPTTARGGRATPRRLESHAPRVALDAGRARKQGRMAHQSPEHFQAELLHGLSTRSEGGRSVHRTRPHLHGLARHGRQLSPGRSRRVPLRELRGE